MRPLKQLAAYSAAMILKLAILHRKMALDNDSAPGIRKHDRAEMRKLALSWRHFHRIAKGPDGE